MASPLKDNVADHYSTSGNKGHYDTLWGQDNIHLGFYPHLESSKGLVHLSFPQAAANLTQRMIRIAGIDHTSKVLDLGCGKGIATRDITESTSARCVGLDFTQLNVERATFLAKERGMDSRLDYVEGSFTALPHQVVDMGPYTHIWSQVALCYAHEELLTILTQAKSVLGRGGKMIITDYLGENAPYVSASGSNFPYLHGHHAWREVCEQAGLVLLRYENLDAHMLEAYRQLKQSSDIHGFTGKDGKPMSVGYQEACDRIESGRMGMNLALLTVPKSGL